MWVVDIGGKFKSRCVDRMDITRKIANGCFPSVCTRRPLDYTAVIRLGPGGIARSDVSPISIGFSKEEKTIKIIMRMSHASFSEDSLSTRKRGGSSVSSWAEICLQFGVRLTTRKGRKGTCSAHSGVGDLEG